jgi:hypothetical protein
LFPVEKTPTRRKIRFFGRGGAFRSSTLAMSTSSETGNPLAKIDRSSKSPETLTSATDHGSNLYQKPNSFHNYPILTNIYDCSLST